MTRIGLVGGSPSERDLVRSWLGQVPGIAGVVGLVANGHHRGSGARVDMVVGLFEDTGATRPVADESVLTEVCPSGRLVALLAAPSERLVQRVVSAGADALVSVESGPTMLAHAIDRVRHGAAWLDPALSQCVLGQLGRRAEGEEALGLTPKEYQVGLCFLRGLSRRAIAAELGVGEETVKTHVRNIYAKLDVTDRAAAARIIRGAAQRDTDRGGVRAR